MNIKLTPKNAKALSAMKNPDAFVNRVIRESLEDKVIPLSKVAARFDLKNTYTKVIQRTAKVYDSVTHEFQGVAIVAVEESETLWVADPNFRNLLSEHSEVVVLKSPRREGIRREKGKSRPIEAKTKNDLT